MEDVFNVGRLGKDGYYSFLDKGDMSLEVLQVE